MNAKFAKTLITAATLAAALAGGVAQAASVQDNTSAGDKYGYSYRAGKFDTFTEGARTGKFDPFTEGARVGKFDPYTDAPASARPIPTRTATAPWPAWTVVACRPSRPAASTRTRTARASASLTRTPTRPRLIAAGCEAGGQQLYGGGRADCRPMESIMSLRDSILLLGGWLVLCVTSGSMITFAAQVLPG